MFDVFISHSGEDKELFVEPLVKDLNKMGLNVWYDKSNIQSGEKVRDSIINGIKESLIFIAILSPNYFHSNWANLELGIIQDYNPDNFIPVIFSNAKELTANQYPFLLNYSYVETDCYKYDIALRLKKLVNEKKQERGLWHIEKTDLKSLVREMYSYNNFKLEQIAIRTSCIIKKINSELLSALNEIKMVLDIILYDVASFENIIISQEVSAIDLFLNMDFLSQNLKEHIKYLQLMYQEQIQHIQDSPKLTQENLYLTQFSLYSIIEWYMFTYFKKPTFKFKKLVPVAPEDFTREDIEESYKIEKLVLPQNLIAAPETDLQWYEYNQLTMIGARDSETQKLVGFFNTLPISDNLFEQIKKGSFDDTAISIDDIRQYDMPGFYKLYLCSFCINPAYNSTAAFKIIYTGFIDFLLDLATELEIFISDIIADGVTQKGENLCQSIGMTKVTTSNHKSNVYSASLIPPTLSSLKLNNKVGHKLITYYQRMYNEYKEIF